MAGKQVSYILEQGDVYCRHWRCTTEWVSVCDRNEALYILVRAGVESNCKVSLVLDDVNVQTKNDLRRIAQSTNFPNH
jgi:hypothetical protein